jgi:DNA-directed RNA polymerase subunit RPC12/RpoP
MERRKAPSSYARQTFIAFELWGSVGGGTGIGLAALVYFLWPNAPIWAFSLAFGVGFTLFLALFIRMRPKFKCPQCGRELGRESMRGQEDGESIRFVCPTCQIEWESGMYAAGGG